MDLNFNSNDLNLFNINFKYWLIFLGFFIFIILNVIGTIKKKNALRFLFLGMVITAIGILYKFFNFIFYPQLAFYLVLPSAIVGALIGFGTMEKPINKIADVELITNKGKKYARNVFAHVAIFAASRHGKTASLVMPYAKHFADNGFSGVYYDYKDGELYEVIKPLFPDNHVTFAIHRPDISARINPISPKYMKDEKDINSLTFIFLDNLLDLSSQNDFFVKCATSLFSGLTLKFALDHKEYCYLPHVCAFIQAVDFNVKNEEVTGKGFKQEAFETFTGLKKFLSSNPRVKMQSASFLLGLASEKQTAGVLSSLANALREVSYPQAFWALSGDDLDFGVNADNNRKVVAVINEPKNDPALSPLLSTVIHSLTRSMMERERKPSFLLMDEGVTLKQKNLGKLTATMASFKIAVVYCIQDMKQGEDVYGAVKFKSILANFSTMFFGRANDADTAKYYENYFEPIKIKTHSTSRSSGKSSSTSTTVGEREVPKYRAHEFSNLTQGKFAMINNGKGEMYQFKLLPNVKNRKLPAYNDDMDHIVIQNYNKIIQQVNDFATRNGLN